MFLPVSACLSVRVLTCVLPDKLTAGGITQKSGAYAMHPDL